MAEPATPVLTPESLGEIVTLARPRKSVELIYRAANGREVNVRITRLSSVARAYSGMVYDPTDNYARAWFSAGRRYVGIKPGDIYAEVTRPGGAASDAHQARRAAYVALIAADVAEAICSRVIRETTSRARPSTRRRDV